MRSAVALLLLLLSSLAGCAGNDPPEVVLVTLAGSIAESGPAYGTDQPDACGVSASTVEIERDPVALTYVGSRPSVSGMREPLAVVGGYGIDLMHVGSCGDPDVLGGVRWADGSMMVAVHVEGYTESRELTVRGGRLFVDGAPLPEGESVRIPFVWAVERQPTPDDARNGTYSYRGNVTVSHLATVPSHRIQAVADCGELPSGC